MEPPWQARGRARLSAQWGPLRSYARERGHRGEGQRVGSKFALRALPGSGKGRFPPGGNLGALRWRKEKNLPGEFMIPGGGWGGAVRKGLGVGGSRPTVADRTAGELGLRKAGLSSSEVKQTALAVHRGSRSPSGKLRPLLHQTLLRALQPRAEAAAREGLRLPVPADSQLIGP